jgi:hypothetical protein
MATPERSKGLIKIRFKDEQRYLDCMMLITHDMQTGFSRDKEGHAIAADYITAVRIIIQNEVLARCELGPGISSNPFLHLSIPHFPEGTAVSVVYQDLHGNEQRLDTTVEYYREVKVQR